MAKPSWISCSPDSGSGGGSVRVTAYSSTSASPRSGTITVKTASGITKTVSVSQEAAEVKTGKISGSIQLRFSGFSGSRLQSFSVTVATSSSGSNSKSLINESGLNHLTNGPKTFSINTDVTWTTTTGPRYTYMELSWQMSPGSDTIGNRIVCNIYGIGCSASGTINDQWVSCTANAITTSGITMSGGATIYKQ